MLIIDATRWENFLFEAVLGFNAVDSGDEVGTAVAALLDDQLLNMIGRIEVLMVAIGDT